VEHVKSLGVSTPVAGAGLALVAGLLLGAAMRPQLAIDQLSPQPLGVWSGGMEGAIAEDPAAQDALAFSAYGGRLPDHVVGADWLALSAPPAAPAAPPAETADAPSGDASPAPQADENAAAAEAHATPAAAEVPVEPDADPTTTAPSTAPEIPALIDSFEPEPEATGDTRLEP
jgi:hypothetical protein